MHQHKPLVPDGGWGWVIVACSFLIHLFVVGTLYALSVLYVSWLEAFHNGKGYTSWILSLAVAVMFGIGIGAGCCYLPSVSMVAMYFSSKRSAAMGIAASGLGVGAFLMPLYLNWMVENYGWRGCMLILSGLSLNMCVLGLLMRPLESAPQCINCKWVSAESEAAIYEGDSMTGAALPLSYARGDCNSSDDSEGDDGDDCEECDTACGVVEESSSFLGSCRQQHHNNWPALWDSPVVNEKMKIAVDNKCVPFPASVPCLVEETAGSTKEITSSHYHQIPSFKTSKPVACSNQNIFKTASKRIDVLKRDEKLGGSLQYIQQSPAAAFSVRSLNITSQHENQNKDVQDRMATLTNLQIMMAGSLYNVVHSSRVLVSLRSLQNDKDLSFNLDTVPVYISVKELKDVNTIECSKNEGNVLLVDKGNGPKKSTAQKLRSKFMETMSVYLRLMRHGKFMWFCTSNFLTNLSFFMPVLYMVDRAIHEGFLLYPVPHCDLGPGGAGRGERVLRNPPVFHGRGHCLWCPSCRYHI